MDWSMPGFPVHHQLLELAQTHVHRVSDTIQNISSSVVPSPPAFSLFQHQNLFQWVSSLHQVSKVLELQLQHSPSSEYSGLISFRMDQLDLLAVQVTLKSLLQHHSSKASILECSAFFIVQLYFSSQLMPTPTFQLLRPKLWRYSDFPFASHVQLFINKWLALHLFIYF